METKHNVNLRAIIFLLFASSLTFGQTTKKKMSFEEYIRDSIPTRKEIDVFLNDMSWAQFDRDVGYILGNYMPHDGLDRSFTL
jgi:hypothetical protein